MARRYPVSGKGLFGLLREAITEWVEDRAARLGAALAFYAIFAIGPLLVIIIGVAGFVFGQSAAKNQIVDSISSIVGEDAANAIQEMLKNVSDRNTDTVASVIGTVVLLFAAAGIFGQLKDSLNTIWKIRVRRGSGIRAMVSRNLLSFLMVLGVGLLLTVSMFIDALLASISGLAQRVASAAGAAGVDVLPNRTDSTVVWQLANYAVTFGITILLFAMVYKVLPDAHISWSTVWVGAVVTSVLFLLGQVGLGIYFRISNPFTALGAAGSLVALLLWIYYSAQIFLVGAEITQVYSRQSGQPVILSEYAQWTSAEIKADREAIAARSTTAGASPQPSAQPATRSSPWFR
jgi:membrane protein